MVTSMYIRVHLWLSFICDLQLRIWDCRMKQMRCGTMRSDAAEAVQSRGGGVAGAVLGDGRTVDKKLLGQRLDYALRPNATVSAVEQREYALHRDGH